VLRSARGAGGADGGATRGDMPREVWILAAVAFSVALGFGIVAPVIPVFAREFGVGQTAAALVISAFAFMRLVFGPGGGWLVNRFGERIVMASGLGIVAVSSLLTGFAQTYHQMLGLRGIGGVGSVMFTISAQSLLLRAVPSHQRGRASSMFSGGFLIGGVTGPFLGGVLGGISLRVPFFVYAGTLLLAGTIAMVYLARAHVADSPAATTGPAPGQTTLREALRHKGYQAALVANAGTGWAIFGIRSSLVPLFVVEVLHRGPLWTGVGLFVGSIAQVVVIYPVGRMADRIGRRPLIITGTGLGAAGSIVLAVSETEPAFLLAMIMFGVTSATLSVGPSAVVGDVVTGRGGTVVAAYGMASDLGAVIGPIVAGLLAEHAGYPAAFTSTGIVLAIGLAMALRMPETMQPPGSHEAAIPPESPEAGPAVPARNTDAIPD
jgi:DHA1 family multidrug resistance protein-like MFS transporter